MTKISALPIADLAYVRVQGPDAEGFLQGQLSNDLRLLTATQAQLAAYSSAKGRMLAVLLLFRHGDDIVLELHRSLLDSTLKRLRMFVLRSKVVLEDAGASLPALGLIGEDAASGLAAHGLPAPVAPLASASANGITIVRRLGALPRYSLHGPQEALQALQQGLPPAEPLDWKRLDMLAGLPTVYPETSDHFVAQMANLDRLGGISFTKGCYTGQEIIARLHYLGQLKRRLFLGHSDVPAASPGQPVYSAGGGGQPVGEVVDAVADGEGRLLVSAVLQLSHAGSSSLALGAADGPALQLLESVAENH